MWILCLLRKLRAFIAVGLIALFGAPPQKGCMFSIAKGNSTCNLDCLMKESQHGCYKSRWLYQAHLYIHCELWHLESFAEHTAEFLTAVLIFSNLQHPNATSHPQQGGCDLSDENNYVVEVDKKFSFRHSVHWPIQKKTTKMAFQYFMLSFTAIYYLLCNITS